MLSFIQILPEAAIIVVIIGAILFTVLAFRNPQRPGWMQGDAMPIAASLAIAAIVCFGIGNMISGGIAAGFGVATAFGLTIAVCIGAAYAMVRGFRIGERLRRSDAGESPFYAVAGSDTLGRSWQRRFRGRAGA